MIKALHTPGHLKESISLNGNDEFIFTGDTLFVGGCGRVDLAGGDPNDMYDSLYNKVLQLNEELIVIPGTITVPPLVYNRQREEKQSSTSIQKQRGIH